MSSIHSTITITVIVFKVHISLQDLHIFCTPSVPYSRGQVRDCKLILFFPISCLLAKISSREIHGVICNTIDFRLFTISSIFALFVSIPHNRETLSLSFLAIGILPEGFSEILMRPFLFTPFTGLALSSIPEWTIFHLRMLTAFIESIFVLM